MTQVELVKGNIWAIMADAYMSNVGNFKRSYYAALRDEKMLFDNRDELLTEKGKNKINNIFYNKIYSFLNCLIHFHQKDFCPFLKGPLFTTVSTIDDSQYSIKKFIDKQSYARLNKILPAILNEFPSKSSKNYVQIITVCQPIFDEYKLYCKFRNECADNWVEKVPFTLRPKCRYKNRNDFRQGWKEILNYLVGILDIV